MRNDVLEKLKNVARKSRTITYGRLMKEFRIPRGHSTPGIGIGFIVGDISNHEHSNGRPRLSAIVVRSQTESSIFPQGHPSGGFFGLNGIPRNLRRTERTYKNKNLSIPEQNFVREEQERVWNWWRIH